MRIIYLTKGYATLVDDEDYEWLSKHQWHTFYTHRGNTPCAARDIKRGKQVFMHRLIMNATKDEQVDHIDRDTLNNQKSNLRLCNSQQNSCNRKSWSKYSFKGIHKVGNSWQARIRAYGKHIHLGCYKTPIEAALRYDAAAVYMFREFASINFEEHKEILLKQSLNLDKENLLKEN